MAKNPTEIRSLARSHTEAAVNTLLGIMNQPKAPAAARVAAAQAVLDRGWGKPTQVIAGDEENPVQILQRIERVIVPALPASKLKAPLNKSESH
jgi:hypothetical protein